jgi:hypothetical protein
MWAQLVNAAIGIWLMASPAVLGYDGAAAMNDRIAGPIAATFAVVAVTEATRGARWGNLPLGLWMIVAPWILGVPSPAIVNGLIVGPCLVSLSAVRGRIEERFGGGWRVLIRGEGVEA